MLTCSCPCAHHEDIWERGGTTPHIINPVLLHNMPLDNNLATILSMITFLLHNISLAIKWNKWLSHSLHILVSLFLWVMIFGQTYPHSLALSGTLALYECVWSDSHCMNVCGQPHTTWMCVVRLTLHECVLSASHYTCITFGENAPSTNWTGSWMGQWKMSWPCQDPTSATHSSIQATDCQPNKLHHHSYPSTVSLILNISVTALTECLYSSHFWYMCYSCNRLSVHQPLLIYVLQL